MGLTVASPMTAGDYGSLAVAVLNAVTAVLAFRVAFHHVRKHHDDHDGGGSCDG